jgi:hypothetical protein
MIPSDQLATKLQEVTDSLAEEIRARYGENRFRYKLMTERFNREMSLVDSANELLDLYREQKEAAKNSPQLDALLCELGSLGVRLDVILADKAS